MFAELDCGRMSITPTKNKPSGTYVSSSPEKSVMIQRDLLSPSKHGDATHKKWAGC